MSAAYKKLCKRLDILKTADETPALRWFEKFPQCRMCRKPSAGLLRGLANESFGHHCQRCADRRLKDSARVRDAITKTETA